MAKKKYTETDFSNLDVHVTNISRGGKEIPWEDVLKAIWEHYGAHKEELSARLGADLDPVLHVHNQMKAILVEIINAFKETSFGMGSLTSENGFNWLGIDFYMDNDLDVFLIEPQYHPTLDEDPTGVMRKFQSDLVDVAVEVTEKQTLGQSILPLEKMGDFELVYDSESNFQFSYEYQRPSKKKGCEVPS